MSKGQGGKGQTGGGGGGGKGGQGPNKGGWPSTTPRPSGGGRNNAPQTK